MTMQKQHSNREPITSSQIIPILHQVAKQLIVIEKEREIYQIMAHAVALILPGAYFVVTKLQSDDMNFRIVESFGFDKYFSAIKKIVGKDPFTIDFPFGELSDEQLQAFESGKIHHFSEGIHDLTRGRINKTICKAIEKMLGVADVCAISFCVEKKYFGGVTLLIPKSIFKSGTLNTEVEMAIETIAYQASYAIQKLRDRSSLIRNAEILQLTNLQIETLLENSSSGFLFEDKSRKILKVNQVFCNMFGIPDPEAITGSDCKIAGQRSAGLFIDSERFLNGIENLIHEDKPCINQELVLHDGRTLERDFIPIKNSSLVGYLWQYRDISDRKRTELELLITQTRFHQLANQLNDIIWMANADGSGMADLNNSFEKYYGLPVSAFVTNPNLWVEMIHPEDRKIAEESANELFATGNTRVEYRIVRPDGRILWLYDCKSIVYDKIGTPIQIGGIASDITERKLLEEQLHIRDFALQASPVAIGLADIEGLLFYANEAYVKLWGFKDKDQVIGKHIAEFATTKEIVNQVVSTLSEGKTYTSEVKITRTDGTVTDAMISAILVRSPDGRPLCQMALFVDITELKNLERELQEQASRLEELNSIKDKFFSIIAHDLKGPFNAILGFTDHLATDYHDLTDDERLRFIQILYTSAGNFYNHLEDLLEWARIQRGQIEIHIEPVNLRRLVIDSVEPYLLNASNKEITVVNTIPEDIIINADIHSLRIVFGNIFNNAIKFTPNGGLIELDATVKNDRIEIRISDSGIGMTSEQIEKLFRLEESQSTPGTNQEKGTGLGLILCKEFLSKNDGSLGVESELGKGSVFTVSLPTLV